MALKALFDFARVKATIADLAGELQSLRSEREELLRRREDIEAAPICRADLLQLLSDWVDRKAADFPRRLEAGLSYYVRHPLVTLPESLKTPASPLKVLTAVADPSAVITLDGFESSLFYCLREPILAGLHQAVESFDFGDSGPPRAERIALIAAIDKRVEVIDAQEMELVQQAEKAGLRL